MIVIGSLVVAVAAVCSSEQYDRLQPVLAPGREARVSVCQRQYAGVACEGTAVTTPPPVKEPTPRLVTPPPTSIVAFAPLDPAGGDVCYANCDAARAAGAAPVYAGDPGYRSKLDRDGDGIGCES